EVERPALRPGVVLADRGQVVQDPDRAAMSGRHQVIPLHGQVVDRSDRQVAAKRTPRDAAVERHVDACLRAAIQQVGAHGVLPDDAAELVGREPAVEPLPCDAEVAGPPEVGLEVVQLVPLGRDIGGSPLLCRSLPPAYTSPPRAVLRWYVAPPGAAPARHTD